MHSRKLSLDSLQVETFEPAAPSMEIRGTVRAYQETYERICTYWPICHTQRDDCTWNAPTCRYETCDCTDWC